MADKEIKLNIGNIGKKKFSIDAQDIVTGRTCIIAQSGAGKSWMIAVLCERLAKNNIPFILIDTEGEYFSLKEKYDMFWAGSDSRCDADISQIDFKDLVTKSITTGTPVIFDVSEVMDETKTVEKLATALYEVESDLREPYLMIVEEADKFIPQSGESLKKIEEIARRGRKRGLGLLIATQRPSLVNKNVLSQCNNQLLGKLSIENDLKAVNLFFDTRKELEELAYLKPGEFFVMGGLVSKRTKIKSAKRETKHKAITPKIKKHKKMKLTKVKQKQVDSETVEEIVSESATDLGIKPKKTVEEIAELVETKKKKQFLLFGPKERVTAIDLVYEPLAYIIVKYLGFLRKPRSAAFYISSRTADYLSTENGLKRLKSFEKLLNLSSDSIKILNILSKKKSSTIHELVINARESDAVIKNNLKKLRDANLATVSGKLERANLYSALEKPNLPSLNKKQIFDFKLEKIKERKLKEQVDLKDIRNIIKAINSKAEIVKYKKFFYPIYKVRFAFKDKTRTAELDGLTGRLIK